MKFLYIEYSGGKFLFSDTKLAMHLTVTTILALANFKGFEYV